MNMPITHVTLMACQAAGVYGEVGTGVRNHEGGVRKYEGGVSEDMGGLHVSVSLWYDHLWLSLVVWDPYVLPIMYSIGHISFKLFKIQISRLMSFGWQIGWQNVCMIDTESKWEHMTFVKGVLWYKWCLLHIDCSDFPVFPVWHDTVRLTRWLSQGKSVKTSLSGALCYKTDVMHVVHMWYSTDVVKVHAWCTRVLLWSGWQDQPTWQHTQSSTMVQPLWVM